MTDLIIGLGSNLGDRRRNLDEAVRLMSCRFGPPVSVSGYIETDPWGFESENRFLNGIVIFGIEGDEEGSDYKCVMSAEEVFGVVQEVEGAMGRIRTGSGYHDRLIDLDILFFGDMIHATPDLVIPHPRLHERLFVLSPLAEICPDKVHPLLGLTIRELLDRAARM